MKKAITPKHVRAN